MVHGGLITGRGVTQPGGRPHAEAMALMQAGELARGATAYVTLEPFFHDSPRGPTCSHLLIEAGVSRVVVASHDPDSRTSGRGIGILRKAGHRVPKGLREQEAPAALEGFIAP